MLLLNYISKYFLLYIFYLTAEVCLQNKILHTKHLKYKIKYLIAHLVVKTSSTLTSYIVK